MSRMQHHHDSAPANDQANGTMHGFDPEFTDIVDYILRITYRIWEGKQVGLCHDYYTEDCPVYTLAGLTIGAQEVTQNTLATLASFPDRTLHADNIIWGGDDKAGFHTSHLISTSMTNLGDTEYGPASGKSATIQVIAHCVCKDNKIVEEWLVRDNYSLLEQLGFDPLTIAQQQAKTAMPERYQQWRDAELARVPATVNKQRRALSSELNTQEWLLASLHNIWNAAMVGDVFQAYTSAAKLHASANRELKGHDEIAQLYISFLGNFSELKVALDYSCQNTLDDDNDDGATDVAVRWTMVGKHTGGTLFGAPTNTPVLVIGESQYRIKDHKIEEEWTVFDQLAIMTQIERARQSQTENLPVTE